MSMQKIPTAFPTDPELLNALQASLKEGHVWVWYPTLRIGNYTQLSHRVRDYTQLSQAKPDEARSWNWNTYLTVRKALAAGLGLTTKPPVGR